MKLKHALKALAGIGLAALLATPTLAAAKSLRFATEPSFPPFEFMGEGGTVLSGFDVDIAKAIAEAQGCDIELVSMPFDSIIPAIITHQVDVGISGFTITEERKKRISFSEPYYKAGLSVMVRTEDRDNFRTADSLKGTDLCAQIGTTGADYALTVEGANVKRFNTSADALMELKGKGCRALVNDKAVNDYYLKNASEGGIHSLPIYLTEEYYGIITSKDNAETLQLVNDGLKKIRDDGTYAEIYRRWFGQDPKPFDAK
ncbi:MAG: basic amino acid ABC transporter substrate-binding protein [Succinivibrionaceae bacterium]|nr:basic amino acid ABC transporter substrate-binding protein [Succinivibrionaceae bacterium]